MKRELGNSLPSYLGGKGKKHEAIKFDANGHKIQGDLPTCLGVTECETGPIDIKAADRSTTGAFFQVIDTYLDCKVRPFLKCSLPGTKNRTWSHATGNFIADVERCFRGLSDEDYHAVCGLIRERVDTLNGNAKRSAVPKSIKALIDRLAKEFKRKELHHSFKYFARPVRRRSFADNSPVHERTAAL